MIRMSDIAEQAGVSQSTVSFVLNGRHETFRISDETRLRVLRAAEELGYRPNHVARAVRTGNTRMVGIIGGDLATEHVGKMVGGVLDELDRHDYTLKILNLGRDGEPWGQAIRRSAELRLMGVIAMHLPLPMLEEFREEAHRYSYPLVLLDSRVPETDLSQIVSDDQGGIADAVDHLVQLGHRKIALINGEAISTLAHGRERAFRAAMEGHALRVPEALIFNGDFRFHERNEAIALKLLGLPDARRPTAILCSSDRIALTVLHMARRLNRSVPQDVSVIGFGNFSASEFCWPSLSTVEQPFEAMGRAAARHLLSRCETKRPPRRRSPAEGSPAEGSPSQGAPERAELPAAEPSSAGSAPQGVVELLATRLIQRESTARAPD